VSESPETTPRIDVDALRHAIYAVSLRHDWANTTDTEDRTEEIAAEYAARASVPAGPDQGRWEEPGHDPGCGVIGVHYCHRVAARPVPAAEPRLCGTPVDVGTELRRCTLPSGHDPSPHEAVPAADDRERLENAIRAVLNATTDRDTLDPVDMADAILRAGVSPSTGDASLREAAQRVSDKASVIARGGASPRWVVDDATFSALRAVLGSPSTGDADRLHEAIRAVYYEDKHPDLSGGLTTDPADARLAAAILRRLG
jgi:hypothetical protein